MIFQGSFSNTQSNVSIIQMSILFKFKLFNYSNYLPDNSKTGNSPTHFIIPKPDNDCTKRKILSVNLNNKYRCGDPWQIISANNV